MPKTKHNPRRVSAKKIRDDIHQRRLDAIASSMNTDKLKSETALPVDDFGRVTINSNHPHYKYWSEED